MGRKAIRNKANISAGFHERYDALLTNKLANKCSMIFESDSFSAIYFIDKKQRD